MSRNLTTEQMKQALNKVHGAPANPANTTQASELSVADLVADSAEFTVAVVTGLGVKAVDTVTNAGSNTLKFADRVKTRFQFQRAVRAGAINLVEPTPTPKARAKPAKSN